MPETEEEDLANKEDAKTFIANNIIQEEQIIRIEITKTGGGYKGSFTVIDPPAPPAGNA
jgi:hypothetical protein